MKKILVNFTYPFRFYPLVCDVCMCMCMCFFSFLFFLFHLLSFAVLVVTIIVFLFFLFKDFSLFFFFFFSLLFKSFWSVSSHQIVVPVLSIPRSYAKYSHITHIIIYKYLSHIKRNNIYVRSLLIAIFYQEDKTRFSLRASKKYKGREGKARRRFGNVAKTKRLTRDQAAFT